MKHECGQQDCGERATQEVCLKLYSGPGAWHIAASAHFYLCDRHAQAVAVGELMSEDDWRRAGKLAAWHGQPAPTASLAKLNMRPLTKGAG